MVSLKKPLKKSPRVFQLLNKRSQQLTITLSRNIEWNGNSYKFTDAPLRKVLDEKKGSSADINLLLGSMLEKAGFDVSPVLLSTRDHGFVRETVPISSQFNYVVCLVKLNDKIILLDATDKFLPTGTLPERCLNGSGFVVAQDGAFTWVPLKSPSKSRKYYNVDLAVTPSGELRGKVASINRDITHNQEERNSLQKGKRNTLKK